MKIADFVIIGSGQGGTPLAAKLAKKGYEVFLFERAGWGGTCVNTGCIPSKTLLASAHAAAAARHAAELGIFAAVRVDFPAVMARVRESIQPQGIADWMTNAGVHAVHAEATLVGPNTVHGGDVTIEADKIIINSGKSPFVPDIPGLADTPYLTYQTFWDLDKLPEKLLVLGGGYTGLELAQAMQRLGSQVHVLERQERIVADEEVAVSRALQQGLEADGVKFHLGCSVREVTYNNGLFRLDIDATVDPLIGSALLITAGRRPNVAALDVAKWGVTLDDQNHVVVNERFQTTVNHIYAIGDVTGQPAFTHVSWEDHRRLLAVLEGKPRQQGDRILAYAFFTEPQVGRVGFSFKEARKHGFNARATSLPLKQVTRAAATAHTLGYYQLVIDDDTDRILGATLVGPQAAELVHIILAHMEADSTWQVLEQSQHIHPTYAEDLPTMARNLVS